MHRFHGMISHAMSLGETTAVSLSQIMQLKQVHVLVFGTVKAYHTKHTIICATRVHLTQSLTNT